MGLSVVDSVPGVVRNKTVAAGASRWLDDLPELVTSLEREWGITVGRPFQDATEAVVARASLEDGTPAVLKLVVPRDGEPALKEITALRLTNGEGCVRLLRDDAARGAMLLEQLGRSLHDLALPVEQRQEILCSVSVQVWRPAAGCALPTGVEKGRSLIDFIATKWEELDGPCSNRAVAHAVACAERRVAGHDDERAVLVHGDVHQWNALEGEGGYKLMDPDGLLAEAEYDMASSCGKIRSSSSRVIARASAMAGGAHRARCHAIWEWGVVERVSTRLLCTQIDLQPVGRHMLEVADHVARLRDLAR